MKFKVTQQHIVFALFLLLFAGFLAVPARLCTGSTTC